METIKELRKKLQTNVLGYPYLQRSVSIYITKFLLPTNIQANQVTILMFLAVILGSVAIFFGYIWVGFFLVYLNIVLDAVDGEVARYRGTYSLRGVYLDSVNHHIGHGLFFLALTFWVTDIFNDPNVLVLIVGVLGSLALILRRTNGEIHRGLFVRPYNKNRDIYFVVSTHQDKMRATEDTPAFSIRKTLGSLAQIIYKLHNFPVMVIILFLAFVSELVLFTATGSHQILSLFIIAYGITSNLYLIREVVGGYLSVEAQVGKIASEFSVRVESSDEK